MVEKKIHFLETFWKHCLFSAILIFSKTQKMAVFCGLGGVAEWLNAPVLKTYKYSFEYFETHNEPHLCSIYGTVAKTTFGNFWKRYLPFF